MAALLLSAVGAYVAVAAHSRGGNGWLAAGAAWGFAGIAVAARSSRAFPVTGAALRAHTSISMAAAAVALAALLAWVLAATAQPLPHDGSCSGLAKAGYSLAAGGYAHLGNGGGGGWQAAEPAACPAGAQGIGASQVELSVAVKEPADGKGAGGGRVHDAAKTPSAGSVKAPEAITAPGGTPGVDAAPMWSSGWLVPEPVEREPDPAQVPESWKSAVHALLPEVRR